MQIAIFAKNHERHLEAAADIADSNSEQIVVFQSGAPWTSAAELLNEHGPGTVPVYIAVVGRGPFAFFRARLQEVLLRPKATDPRTQQLLSLRTWTTSNEDLWSEGKGSLYAISGCQKLLEPIPYQNLFKVSDDKPIQDTYGYSYAVIYAPPDGPSEPGTPPATDLLPPPVRVDAQVQRTVRDTSLVRRLKLLHDHRCQHCGTRLSLPDGGGYSEGHHLQPLGRPHNGPDLPANVVILCANCHALCDLRALPLDFDGLRLHDEHEVGKQFLRYHNDLVTRRRTPH